MFRLSFCAVLALSACTPPSDPCANLCMSAFVEYEPGYEP